MSSLTFTREKQAPEDLFESRSVSGKYKDLLDELAAIRSLDGVWIKVTVVENSTKSRDKAIHTLRTSIQSWKKRVNSKSDEPGFVLSMAQKRISDTTSELWINVKTRYL